MVGRFPPTYMNAVSFAAQKKTMLNSLLSVQIAAACDCGFVYLILRFFVHFRTIIFIL